MDAAPFGALLGVLQKAPFCSDKIGIVSQLCASRAHRFHGRQCVDVLRDVPFVRERMEVLEILAPYIVPLTCEEARAVMETFGMSAERLAALEVLVDRVPLVDVDPLGCTLEDVFAFGKDRERVRALLARARPFIVDDPS